MRGSLKVVLYLVFFGVTYVLANQADLLTSITKWFGLPAAISARISNSLNLIVNALVACILYALYVSDRAVLGGVLKRQVRALYSTFYRNPLSHASPEARMYRVTCFRCCKSGWQRTRGVLVVVWRALTGLEVKRRWRRAFEAIKRGWEGEFLFCVERYGWENDKVERNKTTLVLSVIPDHYGELFAGKVFAENSRYQISETKNINSIIEKIASSIPAKELPQAKPRESIGKSIEKLEEKVASVIEPEEWGDLKSFMLATNTGLKHLFAINPKRTAVGSAGRHCNHFIGFKILKDGSPWGVVSIDALDSRESFAQLIGKDNPDFETLLDGLSNMFSGMISKGIEG